MCEDSVPTCEMSVVYYLGLADEVNFGPVDRSEVGYVIVSLCSFEAWGPGVR